MSGTVRYTCLPLIALSFYASPASAREDRFSFDIAAGPLNESLAAFSAQTGIAIGMSGSAPTMHVPSLRGSYTAPEALRLLLRNTGFRARRLGPNVFEIERAASAITKRRLPPVEDSAPDPLPDIVVTGRKQSELLSDVPAPIAVFKPDADLIVPAAAGSTRTVARSTIGLSATNTGPGATQLYIRGAADSPFLGQGQTAVATLFNDARINFTGPDPDLRLVDMDRVEILRGPQGPLYGTGALGGVYRLVTRRPVLGTNSLEMQVDGETEATGDLAQGASAVANFAIVPDKIGGRLIGYADSRPGWITDIGLATRANWSKTLGGRIGVRLAPVSGWTIDLTGSIQRVRNGDSQYVLSDEDQLSRTIAFREPLRSSFDLVEANVEGPIGRLNLTISSSIAWHRLRQDFDASAAASSFGISGPVLYADDRHYRTVDQEIRLSSATDGRFRWLTGFSYLLADSRINGIVTSSLGGTQQPVAIARQVSELAVFGNADVTLSRNLSAEIGARLFSNRIEDDHEDISPTINVARFVGFSPSASLAWRPTEGALLYLRYASAIRPGGVALGAVGNRYDADEMRNLDLGFRMQLPSGKFSLDLSVFRSSWTHVQSNYLLDNGLVSTHNVGDSHDTGIEATVRWIPYRNWTLSGGTAFQHARLVRSADGEELSVDRRMPVVPDISFNLNATRDFRLGSWQASLGAHLWFTGSTRLSFDPGLDRSTPAYALLGLKASASRGPWTISFYAENVANIRADTFALGNPFSVRSASQFTPVRPRIIGFSLRYNR